MNTHREKVAPCLGGCLYPRNTRDCQPTPEAGRGEEGLSPTALTEKVVLPTPWPQTSCLWGCETVRFWCSDPFWVLLYGLPRDEWYIDWDVFIIMHDVGVFRRLLAYRGQVTFLLLTGTVLTAQVAGSVPTGGGICRWAHEWTHGWGFSMQRGSKDFTIADVSNIPLKSNNNLTLKSVIIILQVERENLLCIIIRCLI